MATKGVAKQEEQVLQIEEVPQPTPKSFFQKFGPMLLLMNGILLLIVIGGGAYYLGMQKSASGIPTTQKTILPTASPQSSPSANKTSGVTVTGKLIKIDRDLGLINPARLDEQNSFGSVTYYDAGKYVGGKYDGYKRIVAMVPSQGPGGPEILILATNNDTTYVISGDASKVGIFPDDNWQNPYYFVKKDKVTSVDALDFVHPETISLDDKTVLFRGQIFYDYVKSTTEKDSYDNQLVADFSPFPSLKSPISELKFYGDDESIGDIAYENTDTIRKKYVVGSTKVIVVDAAGLAYAYTPATSQSVEMFKTLIAKHDAIFNQYYVEVAKFEKKEIAKAPEYPTLETPGSPSLGFEKSEIQTPEPVYSTYDIAIPGACGMDINTVVTRNISDSDLKKIGSVRSSNVYILTDKGHPLNTLQYSLKTNMDNATFLDLNKQKKPSFEKYVSKNPLLFLKDYWGRLVALGEYDYKLMGGCGKPVVYLYPEKPTEVTVSLLRKIDFTTTIPTYANAWKVKALPDGTLIDLQPQKTDCSVIDSSKPGSEYAKEACLKNAYPYLYWSGNVIGSSYPKATRGWIINRSNLQSFLNHKLDEIGFSQKEKSDMMGYWVPEILLKNSPYYRISFFQTQQMNDFVPMNISPIPDSINRLFLDWEPLDSGSISIPPQQLIKFSRHGFTLVEWGGLKR